MGDATIALAHRRHVKDRHLHRRQLAAVGGDDRRSRLRRDATARLGRIALVRLALDRLHETYGRYVEALGVVNATDKVIDQTYRDVLAAHDALERAQRGGG